MMDIDDAALMFKGWGEEMLYEQQTLRRVTAIIADVVNKSFGGKGAWKAVMNSWRLPGDAKPIRAAHLELLKKFKEYDLKHGINKTNGRR